MNDKQEYTELQSRLARGWNTWNTRNLLCWVKLPSAIALNLGIKSYCGGNHVREFFVGQHDVRPAGHAYDGSYSDISLKLKKTSLRVRTATVDGDLVLLAEPECTAIRKSILAVEIGVLWNRPGQVGRGDDHLLASAPDDEVRCYPAGKIVDDPNIVSLTPYLGLELSGPTGFSTGKPRTLDEIRAIVEKRRGEFEQTKESHGELAEVYDAIQTCTAWDTIYEPIGNRVVTPVSRSWNSNIYGGYVLFCWDTFFAGLLASIDNPDLAHANVVEILRERTEGGFVPNISCAYGRKSRDRSQPPVGSVSILDIFRRHKQAWLLEQTFEPLLEWNRWWMKAREQQGYLCWGSNPFEPVIGEAREINWQNKRMAAALESGLDNSPMYDDVPFDDKGTHMLPLADVGLMGLYVGDCRALAEIATELGRDTEAAELTDRANAMTASLQTLWSEEDGIFLNKRLDTGEFDKRLSPTHFYPLLGKAATDEQAQRMVDEHLLNPSEFWGEWVIPSIARDDPAYADQDYWRGRIWAPMNWLVYLGLRNYDQLADARLSLVEKSKDLLLKEWRGLRHIHENYDANTGEGCGVVNSDHFYHWGGLLGLMALLEEA
jgi:putative isomerase